MQLRQSGGHHTGSKGTYTHIKDAKQLPYETRRYLGHDAHNAGGHGIIEAFFKGLIVVV